MVTLSYAALLGLLLAAFILGLIFPIILIISMLLNTKMR